SAYWWWFYWSSRLTSCPKNNLVITPPMKSTVKHERKPVLVGSSADKTVSEAAVVLQASVPSKPRGKDIYTCPMHPEVQQEYPGDCPKCGMALELKTVTVGTDDEENVELLDMTKRFWIGAALALPVFVLAMTHLIPALAQQPWVDSSASRWLQLALATQVVLWAGWPLLHRGWCSSVRCSNSVPAAARAAPSKHCSTSHRPRRDKSPRAAIMKSRSTG